VNGKNPATAQLYAGVSCCHSGRRLSAAAGTALKQLLIRSSAGARAANRIFRIVWRKKKDSESALCHWICLQSAVTFSVCHPEQKVLKEQEGGGKDRQR